jgi:hypothetical protein
MLSLLTYLGHIQFILHLSASHSTENRYIKEKNDRIAPPESEFEADITVLTTENSVILRAVKTCLKAGLSESRIIKDVLGYEGGKYQDGKALLAAMRQEHGF